MPADRCSPKGSPAGRPVPGLAGAPTPLAPQEFLREKAALKVVLENRILPKMRCSCLQKHAKKLKTLSADWLDYTECGSLLCNNCPLFSPIKMSTNQILETALTRTWECGDASEPLFSFPALEEDLSRRRFTCFNVSCYVMTRNLIFQPREPSNPAFQRQR